jgi:hypothetical protein
VRLLLGLLPLPFIASYMSMHWLKQRLFFFSQCDSPN